MNEMNDLISRAAAIDAIVFNSENKFAVDVLNDVPAVDAIPVTWLKDSAGRYEYSGCTDSADVVMAIIEDWKKEQEAR